MHPSLPTRPTVRAFTKPDCVFCARAKRTLTGEGIDFQSYDVTTDARTANASAYFSGAYTVPQIFLGDYHVGSADDLDRLAATGRLAALTGAPPRGDLDLDAHTDDELAHGAADLALSTVIPTSDGTHDPDPQTWPILHMYRRFFGFWPNTFAYLHRWPAAYKLFVYCQNAAAVQTGGQRLGRAVMSEVAYATSRAHGCSYCMTHAVAVPGATGPADPDSATGPTDPDSAVGPHEAALTDLAARATRNAVTPQALAKVRDTVDQARHGDGDAQARMDALTMVVASFGFLNVFNDLVGLEIEGDWAATASARGVAAGRHAVGDTNPRNLDHELPSGGPTLPQLMAGYDELVGDPETYAERELGFVPAWVRAWPAAQRRRHCHLYVELMRDRPHSRIPADLKHLMARVSAVARDHGYLAAAEGYLAFTAAPDRPDAVTRIDRCVAAATGRADDGGVFDDRERAALRLAWLSAQVPLVTPRRQVQPAIDHFDADELVELAVVCAVASMLQRFAALTGPAVEPQVREFLARHNLSADSLVLRYPLPDGPVSDGAVSAGGR
ncbi:glutaredoxin domain-containing protein [Solwaraspora sp. WMMD792]|uniref:glutaredoxin domain-containing protein n=1 Tax=Solwaraspora sp. WMMD792 TaxID=3016099 RepID=UPI002415DE3C|nr:glutaredoxin domain-containing protein [Solwaraspora sp. WMMD792]MDG4772871.1 glutaredoxin domain-containing protein [Solwaraspora sp. WMMD792]